MKKITKCKFSLLLFLFFIAPAILNASVQEAVVNLNFTEASLSKVLSEIGRQTSLSLVYNTKDVNPNQVVTIKVNNEKLSAAMGRLLKNTNLSFSVRDNKYLVLFSQEKMEKLQVQQGKHIIKGSVADEHGETLIGVSVLLKETATGTITDIDGNFSLEIAGDDAVLVFTYMGYKSVTLPIVAGKTLYNVVMKENSQVLGEVVVTAMGIERKAASLTYATQTVSNKDITRTKSVNFINSLQGKSAGLSITPNSSGAGGGASKILLRGQSSISGNNQPLIVLDGIPLSNGMGGQVGANDIVMAAGRDGGDLLSTINPDDIANMTILKGPNAAALYGSSANNGVLIITTKSGAEGKVRIDVSSNSVFDTPLMFTEFQKEYGAPITGYSMGYNGWGKRMADYTDEELARFPYGTRNGRDNLDDFYSTGMTFNNSVSVSSGTEFSKSYFSYGNTTQRGLIENNKFSKHNFMFKQSYELFNKRLTLDFTINYINQKIKNTPVAGKALSAIMPLYRAPANIDMRYFERNYQHIGQPHESICMPGSGNRKLVGENIQTWDWFNDYMNNPYWVVNKMYSESIRNRILTSFAAKLNIMEGLKAQARVSVDQNLTRDKGHEYATVNRSSRTLGGQFYTSESYNRDIFSDYLLTYERKIGDKIDINATGGTSFKYSYNHNNGMDLAIDTAGVVNLFLPENSKREDNLSSLRGNERWKNNWEAAVFATVQVGYNEMFYLDGSFRGDWSYPFQQFNLTLGNSGYVCYAYYSVGGNALLKKILFPNFEPMDALKFRVSYSLVGNSIPNNDYLGRKLQMDGGLTSRNAEFDSPKPETTEAIEMGIDGAFFNNTLGFDLTLYQSILGNQFLEITTKSGQTKPVNSGKVRNRGVEFSVNYNWRVSRDFSWLTGFNIANNQNVILKIAHDKDGNILNHDIGPKDFKIRFYEGKSYGDLYVNTLKVGPDGRYMVSNYAPQVTTDCKTFAGNTVANTTFGWNNTLNYKNFSAYILLDGKIGGKVISLTEGELDRFGLSQRTADARNNSHLMTMKDGSQQQMMYLPDGQEVTVKGYYEKIGSNYTNAYVYDATNIRVRELSLGYTFFDLFGLSRHLTVSLVARNLGFIYKNAPVDPDISMSASNGMSGIDVYALPTTRSFGLNIKASF